MMMVMRLTNNVSARAIQVYQSSIGAIQELDREIIIIFTSSTDGSSSTEAFSVLHDKGVAVEVVSLCPKMDLIAILTANGKIFTLCMTVHALVITFAHPLLLFHALLSTTAMLMMMQ